MSFTDLFPKISNLTAPYNLEQKSTAEDFFHTAGQRSRLAVDIFYWKSLNKVQRGSYITADVEIWYGQGKAGVS